MYLVYSLQSHLEFSGCIEGGAVGMEVRFGCG